MNQRLHEVLKSFFFLFSTFFVSFNFIFFKFRAKTNITNANIISHKTHGLIMAIWFKSYHLFSSFWSREISKSMSIILNYNTPFWWTDKKKLRRRIWDVYTDRIVWSTLRSTTISYGISSTAHKVCFTSYIQSVAIYVYSKHATLFKFYPII